MRRRMKNRIGVTALTVVYSLLAFPLTAQANPGVGYIVSTATAQFGSSGECDETGEGRTLGKYTAHDDHGFWAIPWSLIEQPAVPPGNNGALISIGYLNLCGELSRQPSDDPALAAVGAICQSGGEAFGFQVPTGGNGYGRISYHDGALDDHYIQLWDVRMAFTPASGMVFKSKYTSSPGMPNASTGTAIIYMTTSSFVGNDCLLLGGNLYWGNVHGGLFTLVPD